MKRTIKHTTTTSTEIDVQLPYYSKNGDYIFYKMDSESSFVRVQLFTSTSTGIERVFNNFCIENIFDPENKPCTPDEFNAAFDKAMNIIPKPPTCDTCDGKGEAYFSCCTGEAEDDDFGICSQCKEHLGLDTCDDCGGTGIITN